MEIAKVTGRDIAFPSQGMEEVKSSLRLSKENFNHTGKTSEPMGTAECIAVLP